MFLQAFSELVKISEAYTFHVSMNKEATTVMSENDSFLELLKWHMIMVRKQMAELGGGK